MSHQIETTDLSYAALLLTVGGEIDHIQDCGRYSKVTIAVPDGALARLQDKTLRLARLAERGESVAELQIIYEQSMLSSLSDAYYQLKRRIARRRDK